jgi:hypothetical protein
LSLVPDLFKCAEPNAIPKQLHRSFFLLAALSVTKCMLLHVNRLASINSGGSFDDDIYMKDVT